MRRTVFPAILMLLFSGPAFAEVPNTFKSGTKAVASEVNENFSYLETQITDTNKNVENLRTTSTQNDNALTKKIEDLRTTSTQKDNALTKEIEDLRTASTEKDNALAVEVKKSHDDLKAIDTRLTKEKNQIEEKITAVNDKVSGMESKRRKPAYEYEPYNFKYAEIGDTIATIDGEVFVLGAIPFREYRTGDFYKIIMPLKRYECNTTTKETLDDGDIEITNCHCEKGSTYYYECDMKISHTTFVYQEDVMVSGFPASFNDHSEEWNSLFLYTEESRENEDVIIHLKFRT